MRHRRGAPLDEPQHELGVVAARSSAEPLPVARTVRVPARPAVASPMPVSAASNPVARHGIQAAVASAWRTKRWPPKSRSGVAPGVGSVSSWSTNVGCSAGPVSSNTSRPGELSSTRWRMCGGCSTESPACIVNGAPWSSYTTRTQPRRQ